MRGQYKSYSGDDFPRCSVLIVVLIIVTNGAIVIHTQRLKSDPGGN
ncbi:methyl-accepting chemotaxis protein II, partial [Yersinia pestis PY-06]